MKTQLDLGQLIVGLSICKPDALVVYDFAGLIPTEFNSYRGYYEQLALGWKDDPYSHVNVPDLLGRCRAAVGRTYTGWKGGEFVMSTSTPLWVANYGDCHGTAIVGVINEGWRVILETRFTPDK